MIAQTIVIEARQKADKFSADRPTGGISGFALIRGTSHYLQYAAAGHDLFCTRGEGRYPGPVDIVVRHPRRYYGKAKIHRIVFLIIACLL